MMPGRNLVIGNRMAMSGFCRLYVKDMSISECKRGKSLASDTGEVGREPKDVVQEGVVTTKQAGGSRLATEGNIMTLV
jgi:hypothetical protein